MHSRNRHQNAKRSRWAGANTPDALRRRRAKNDARREALARDLPPVDPGPEPLSHWQTITVQLYVPTSGRCDQHAAVIDGKPVGLLSATQIGVMVRKAIAARPSVRVMADARCDGYTARDEQDAAAAQREGVQ
jgi:hypothetical protein